MGSSNDSGVGASRVVAQGDGLAAALIAGYWRDFHAGSTCSYYAYWPEYVPGDAWAHRAQWVEAARRCVEAGTNLLAAYEILVAEGLAEYVPSAIALIEGWHASGGHDAYYFFDLLARLPDSELRRHYLGVDVSELIGQDDGEGWNRSVRRALIAVEDVHTCEALAARVVHDLSVDTLDEVVVEGLVLPTLVELGPLCRTYVPETALARAKQFCREQLAKDEAAAHRRRRVVDGERCLWIADEIACIAWRVGWVDVLRDLEHAAWYWSSLFEWYGDVRRNLLVWTLLASNGTLVAQALKSMKGRAPDRLEGAIAWSRLRQRPWPVEAQP